MGLWCRVSVTPDEDASVSHPCETAQGSRVMGFCDSRNGGASVGTGHLEHPLSLLVGCLG